MRVVRRTRVRKVYRRGIWMRLKSPDLLKTCRRMKGLTQVDLALMAKCTQQTISLLETGKMTTLSADLAGALAKKLGVPWGDLFVLHESVPMPSVTTEAHDNWQRVPA